MSEEIEQHILRKYSLTKKLGSGAYGHVWKVTDRKTGQTLALKKIFDAFQHSTDAQRTFREIVFLHELNHSNIVKLYNVMRAENDKDLYLVFEFLEADLHNAIGQKILKDIHNRFIIYQVMKGIKFMHSAQIIHRDLKPSNLLINSDCQLKICDFGLARSLVLDKEGGDIILTEEVATRWYRAPEVLLGSQNYEKSADIWSIGCIMGEVLNGKPMFPGNSTLNQLEKIVSFTGNPSKEDILSLNSEVASSMMASVHQFKVKELRDWFKSDIPSEAIDLVSRMLSFNPSKRPTADEILRHPYLSQFHNPKEETESTKIIYPPVSDNKKLNMKQYRELIYDRIKKIYPNHEEEVPVIIPRPPSPIRAQNNHHRLINKEESSHYLEDGTTTPIRHSTGKNKTISFGSSYSSSFGQYQNQQTQGSFYHSNSINPIEPEEHKIQRKSSLKDLLKNKKGKEQVAKSSTPLPQSSFLQKYYRKPAINATLNKENKITRNN